MAISKLSSPVYNIPMDDTTLALIGRIAVIWGHVIFHLDQLMLDLLGNRTTESMKQYPTHSLKRKLTDLGRELSKPENAKFRPHLRKVHQEISALASDRNVIFHGIWGHLLDRDNQQWLAVSKSHTRDEPFRIEDLNEFHERLVQASATVADANWRRWAEGEPPQTKNRLQLWADGPPTAESPPAPPRYIR